MNPQSAFLIKIGVRRSALEVSDANANLSSNAFFVNLVILSEYPKRVIFLQTI